jgi:hypothetical protein
VSEGSLTQTPPEQLSSGARSPAPRLAGLTALPVSALVTLYLLATGRWGSYVSVPGVAVYISDILLSLALLQVGLALYLGRVSLRSMLRAPLVLQLVLALLVYATVRLAVGRDVSLIALRDAAPYGYAVVALLAFLLPVRRGQVWRPLIYAALVFHLVWTATLWRLPGYPWDLPVLGTDATIFVIRPDFDATVLGVGAALAGWDILTRRRSLGTWQLAALVAFAAASTFRMLEISTRAGLLAGGAALAAVAVTRLSTVWGGRASGPGPSRRRMRVALVLGCIAVVAVVGLTPAGSRLGAGFGLGSDTGGAGGTVNARIDAWSMVVDYVIRRPERTGVGVGFGRDFIAESGSAASLEGIYQNVRSPHNYIIGTMARLGVGGALLGIVIVLTGWWLAVSTLRRGRVDTATVLAALLVVSIPVVSLLGVVLESPFGAIPYFWALGQLAAASAGAGLARTMPRETDAAT